VFCTFWETTRPFSANNGTRTPEQLATAQVREKAGIEEIRANINTIPVAGEVIRRTAIADEEKNRPKQKSRSDDAPAFRWLKIGV
jgi:hypothetical protein